MRVVSLLFALSLIAIAHAAEPVTPPDLATTQFKCGSGPWLNSYVAATIKARIEEKRYDEALAMLNAIIEAGNAEKSPPAIDGANGKDQP